LQRQRHVADLVEKQRAVVGQLELALAPLAVGAGVGAGATPKNSASSSVSGTAAMLTVTNERAARRCGVDRVREQLLAGAGIAKQQHRRIGAGDAARLALDLERGRAGADEARDRVLGPALRGELALRVFQLALQPRELGHQRLHRRLGVVHQHQADRADHHARVVAQRQPANQEGAGLVGEQIHQDRAPGFDDLVHQRVGHHLFDAFADEVALALETERR
jgi:hypothetical protein